MSTHCLSFFSFLPLAPRLVFLGLSLADVRPVVFLFFFSGSSMSPSSSELSASAPSCLDVSATASSTSSAGRFLPLPSLAALTAALARSFANCSFSLVLTSWLSAYGTASASSLQDVNTPG